MAPAPSGATFFSTPRRLPNWCLNRPANFCTDLRRLQQLSLADTGVGVWPCKARTPQVRSLKQAHAGSVPEAGLINPCTAGFLREVAEESLLQTRRPVLLAPTRLQTDFTGVSMIAWDESPECWRAVSGAIPFLTIAKSVQVVSIDRESESRRASQAEVLAYLRCHGIAATARVVAPHLRSVGDTLLVEAHDNHVGLLVMGAYSHSRLRELLLGGATQHILKNAAATPVFMAH